MPSLTEQIRQLQAQGYSNTEIINFFQEQGMQPREINDALARTQVKQAIGEENNPPQQTPAPPANDGAGMEGMSPSMVDNVAPQEGIPEQANQIGGAPPQQTDPIDEMPPAPGQTEEVPAPEQQNYNPDQPTTLETGQMPNYNQGQGIPATSGNMDLISEITEQLINEKVKNLKGNINSLIESSTLLAVKVEKIDNRLKKIESIIDELQMTLLRKSNNEQQNIADIKTEMVGMQEGFSKILNPLATQIRSFENRTPRKTTHKTTKKKKK